MSALTPGPWTVSATPVWKETINGADGRPVATAATSYRAAETIEANARLIAAAPLMLTALKLLLKSHDATCAGEACQLSGIDIARMAVASAEEAS